MTPQDSYTLQAEHATPDAPFRADRNEDSGAGIMAILLRFALRKWLIIRITAITAAVGVVVSLLLPVRYTATTKIMTPRQSPSSAALFMNQAAGSALAGSLSLESVGGLSFRNPNDIYIGLMKSRTVVDEIIRQFKLTEVYKAKNMTAARKALDTNTRAITEKSGLIALSVSDRDRQRAAEIANAYTAELRVLTKTLAITEASQRRLFYEEQLRSAKEDLIVAETSLRDVQRSKGIVQLDAQARATVAGLTDLRARTAVQQIELDTLRAYSTERNPQVQIAEKQLGAFQDQTAQLEERDRVSHSSGFGLQDIAGAGQEFLRAQHDVLYRQALFDLLIKQYDAAKLDEAKEAAVIQVVETAVPPDLRTSPHRVTTVLMFAILGFLAACAFLYLQGFLQRNPDISKSMADIKRAIVRRRA